MKYRIDVLGWRKNVNDGDVVGSRAETVSGDVRGFETLRLMISVVVSTDYTL